MIGGARTIACEEAADCAIVLTHIVRELGGSLQLEMTRKCRVIEGRLKRAEEGAALSDVGSASRPSKRLDTEGKFAHLQRSVRFWRASYNANGKGGWVPIGETLLTACEEIIAEVERLRKERDEKRGNVVCATCESRVGVITDPHGTPRCAACATHEIGRLQDVVDNLQVDKEEAEEEAVERAAEVERLRKQA